MVSGRQRGRRSDQARVGAEALVLGFVPSPSSTTRLSQQAGLWFGSWRGHVPFGANTCARTSIFPRTPPFDALFAYMGRQQQKNRCRICITFGSTYDTRARSMELSSNQHAAKEISTAGGKTWRHHANRTKTELKKATPAPCHRDRSHGCVVRRVVGRGGDDANGGGD